MAVFQREKKTNENSNGVKVNKQSLLAIAGFGITSSDSLPSIFIVCINGYTQNAAGSN